MSLLKALLAQGYSHSYQFPLGNGLQFQLSYFDDDVSFKMIICLNFMLIKVTYPIKNILGNRKTFWDVNCSCYQSSMKHMPKCSKRFQNVSCGYKSFRGPIMWEKK